MKKPLWVKAAGGLLATVAIAAIAAAIAALAAVFMAYLNPHVVRDLATQLWACF